MSRAGEKTNTELIRACLIGDPLAWERLVDLVTPLIFSICGTMRLSREESFDVFGQVSYMLLRNLDNVKSADKLMSYVATMTRREIGELSRRSRLAERSRQAIVKALYDITPESPEKSYELTRLSEIVNRAMVQLPERDYRLLRALFFEEEEPNYEHIAARFNMPVSSVGPTRLRCLKKLYRILKQKRFER